MAGEEVEGEAKAKARRKKGGKKHSFEDVVKRTLEDGGTYEGQVGPTVGHERGPQPQLW